MSYAFDTDTAVHRIDDSTFRTRLDGRWSINVVPNGGYSAAALVRAMLETTGRADPLSVTTHFYKAAVPDAEATVRIEPHRNGRNFANVSAVLLQDGVERSRSTAVLGSLPDPPPTDPTTPPPPILPPPEDCAEREPGSQGFPIPLTDMVEIRLDRDLGTSEIPEFGAWMRFRDGRPPDVLALGLFADALPPAVLALLSRVGWVPTLELTVHSRRRPVDGWIRASVSTTDIQGQLLIEDVLLWDESDALVAQARQLAMLLR